MFRFHKTLDVITLFHKASVPSSMRVYALLKQASAAASEYATEDQASDHTAQTQPKREPFELDVSEQPPTPDQLQSILEYIKPLKVDTVVKGAVDEADANRKIRGSASAFNWPVTVDWANGKVVAGDKESEILKMLERSKED